MARVRVLGVKNNPHGRVALRTAWYARYAPSGLGGSELDFEAWEVTRGVLNPLHDPAVSRGSPWWREVNLNLCFDAELAGLLHDAGYLAADPSPEIPPEAQLWLAFIQAPTSRAWYRAHNRSIVDGYLRHCVQARQERQTEQDFMNEVLYRLLFAQAAVRGDVEGPLGKLVADPALPAVEWLTHIVTFYPLSYPLGPFAKLWVEHEGDPLVDILDEVVILPHLTALFAACAAEIDQPALTALVVDGKPIYPEMTPQVDIGPCPLHAMAPPAAPPAPKKVVILGGGMSALTAAHELTQYEGWQAQYDITVHVRGWRLGGKTSSGRGPSDRIEEVGIHIAQGWYDNAFLLIDQIYRERRRHGIDLQNPYQDWQDAFLRNNATLLTEYAADRGIWLNWPMVFPQNADIPGQGAAESTLMLVKKSAALIVEMFLGSPYATGESILAKGILDWFFPPSGQGVQPGESVGPLARFWHGTVTAIEDVAEAVFQRITGESITQAVLSAAHALVEAMENSQGFQRVIDFLRHAIGLIEQLLGALFGPQDELRRLQQMLEFAVVNLTGILADVYDPADGQFHFYRIDDIDYRAWLKKHGASDTLTHFVAVRFFYTGTFANQIGIPQQGGSVAAGVALEFVLRSVGYKGSFVWQFRSGIGDGLVMPLYQVLAHRGVKFEFFSEVQAVTPGTDGTIASVQVAQQVTLVQPYDPIHRAPNGIAAWPAQPRWQFIEPAQAAQLQAEQIDLESPWANWQPVSTRTLQLGRDFDHVLLAIPIAVLPAICPQIIAEQPAWQRMLAAVQTTQTISAQLWMKPSLVALGMEQRKWGMGEQGCAANVVVYENPLYSWLDESQTIVNEGWTGEKPQVAAYFTGALTDAAPIPPYSDHGFPQTQFLRVSTLTEQWLHDNMGWFWPKATTPYAPRGVDPALIQSAFYRANINPSDRYTLSVPQSNATRLAANQTGYSNLWIAGDWTNFGINVGYFEGAVISGLRAAHAIMDADAWSVYVGVNEAEDTVRLTLR